MKKPFSALGKKHPAIPVKTFLLVMCLLLAPSFLHAQSLELVSSEPAHMSANVALETTVSFTFNMALDTNEINHYYFGVLPQEGVIAGDLEFSQDGKTVSIRTQHQPDTDYLWVILPLPLENGEIGKQFYTLNYTTAAAVSDVFIEGELSYINIPIFDFFDKQSASHYKNFPAENPLAPIIGPLAGISDKPAKNRFEGLQRTDRFLPSFEQIAQAGMITSTDEVDWSYSLVLLISADNGELPDPFDADFQVNAAVPDPHTREYTLENVRPGDYFVFGTIIQFDPHKEPRPFAMGVYTDEDGAPKILTIDQESPTGIDFTLFGFLPELAQEMSDSEAFAIAKSYMETEWPGTWPVALNGVDSSNPETFFKQTQGLAVPEPTGKSYIWIAIFLNQADSLIHLAFVIDNEVAEVFAIPASELEMDEDFDLFSVPPLPDTFVSSQVALATARDNNFDNLLLQLTEDSWYEIFYELMSFDFDFTGLFDDDPVPFWMIEFDSFTWDPDNYVGVANFAVFYINALDGSLVYKEIFEPGDPGDPGEPVDARDAYLAARDKVLDLNTNARAINLFGSDSEVYPDYFFRQYDWDFPEPSGMSTNWTVLFIDDTEEVIYWVGMDGDEVRNFQMMDFDEMPILGRPNIPFGDYPSLPEPFITSQAALDKALEYGLDEDIDDVEEHSWSNIWYNLGAMQYAYPDLLDENDPISWMVQLKNGVMDYEAGYYQITEYLYFIDASNGDLLAHTTKTYPDYTEPVSFMEAHAKADSVAALFFPDSEFIQAYGRSEFDPPGYPGGKSRLWMLVWFDFEKERVDIIETDGTEPDFHEWILLEDIPPDQRPDTDFRPLGEILIDSEQALAIAMDNGMRDVIDAVPEPDFDAGETRPDARVNFHLLNAYELFPDFLDEDSNPFWNLDMNIHILNPWGQTYVVYNVNANFLIDARTGAYLGSVVKTDAEQILDIPARITLHQNYPNPFNPVTTIHWELDAEQEVRLSVYDLLGRHVATLAAGHMPAGNHRTTFDASNLASGVYIYRLEAANTVLNRKMTLVK